VTEEGKDRKGMHEMRGDGKAEYGGFYAFMQVACCVGQSRRATASSGRGPPRQGRAEEILIGFTLTLRGEI